LVHDSQWPRRGSDGKEHWLSGPLESGSTTAAPTPPQPRSGAARTRLEHEDWADIFPLGIPLTSRSIPRKTWLSHNPRALIQSAFFCPFLPRPSLPFSAYICNGGTERPAESFCKPDFWGGDCSAAENPAPGVNRPEVPTSRFLPRFRLLFAFRERAVH